MAQLQDRSSDGKQDSIRGDERKFGIVSCSRPSSMQCRIHYPTAEAIMAQSYQSRHTATKTAEQQCKCGQQGCKPCWVRECAQRIIGKFSLLEYLRSELKFLFIYLENLKPKSIGTDTGVDEIREGMEKQTLEDAGGPK